MRRQIQIIPNDSKYGEKQVAQTKEEAKAMIDKADDFLVIVVTGHEIMGAQKIGSTDNFKRIVEAATECIVSFMKADMKGRGE